MGSEEVGGSMGVSCNGDRFVAVDDVATEDILRFGGILKKGIEYPLLVAEQFCQEILKCFGKHR
jgi:hypothetical protein